MRNIEYSATRVFVYGTLMRGEPNHGFLANAEFVGPATTAPEYVLVTLGAFPAMVRGGIQPVEGEVYLVGPDALERLDRLEGHPKFYRREQIILEDDSVVDTYLLSARQVAGCPVVNSGSWRRRRG